MHPARLLSFYTELEKIAETEKERAHKWGKRGALIGIAPRALMGAIALTGAAVSPELRGHLKHISKSVGGAHKYVGHAALAGSIDAAAGYGVGRLAHRVIKGKATDKQVVKKEKTSSYAPKLSPKQSLLGIGALHQQVQKDIRSGKTKEKDSMGDYC